VIRKRKCVYNWKLRAWVEPSMERAWFFGRVLAGVWMWRALVDLSSADKGGAK
jgi:hypothetical protein